MMSLDKVRHSLICVALARGVKESTAGLKAARGRLLSLNKGKCHLYMRALC